MRLAERLARLEQAAGPAEAILIIRRIVSPGELNREIRTLRQGERRWERREGETEKALIHRGEVAGERLGNAVTILFAE